MQDTENVAKQLKKVSNGKIKTGVYHAKLADSEKENLHKAWRCGTIKVVCATIGILFIIYSHKADLYLNNV
jgi:ATP-dependent DNA helicase Q1